MTLNREPVPASEDALIADLESARLEAVRVREIAFVAFSTARGATKPSSMWDAATNAAHAEHEQKSRDARDAWFELHAAKLAAASARASRSRAERVERGIAYKAAGIASFAGRPVVELTAEDLELAKTLEYVRAAKTARDAAQATLDQINAAASKLQVDRARAMERLSAERQTVRDATTVLTRLERARANRRSENL